jgi:hypothetical protein
MTLRRPLRALAAASALSVLPLALAVDPAAAGDRGADRTSAGRDSERDGWSRSDASGGSGRSGRSNGGSRWGDPGGESGWLGRGRDGATEDSTSDTARSRTAPWLNDRSAKRTSDPASKRKADPSTKPTTDPTTPPTTEPEERPDAVAKRLEALRRRCLGAVDSRLTHLRRLQSRVAGAENLTDSHEAALSSTVSASAAGLTTLRATIEADTDLATLEQHCRDVVTGFRVYVLVSAQVHLVIAADNIVARAGRLEQTAESIAQAIAEAQAAGVDTARAEELLAEMREEIASGSAAAAGVADRVLGVTVDAYNADPGVLGGARAALRSARSDLSDARRLGARALASLHGKT